MKTEKPHAGAAAVIQMRKGVGLGHVCGRSMEKKEGILGCQGGRVLRTIHIALHRAQEGGKVEQLPESWGIRGSR